MSRAESARTNNDDEIPLARRSSPLRRPRNREVGLLVLLSSLMATLAVLSSFNLLPGLKRSNPFVEVEAIPSADGRLLGHYPYPEAPNDQLISAYPGLDIHRETYKALMQMSSAASRVGINLVLLSAYRSIDLQREIFYGRKSARNQIAIERAKVSAPPGYSEHSTGYAIDLGDSKRRETDFEVEFESTDAFRWLQRNAAKYHFVLSFPRGNPQKVSYEPWHWRFEGTVDALRQFEAANEMRRSSQP